jgi:cytochrome c5
MAKRVVQAGAALLLALGTGALQAQQRLDHGREVYLRVCASCHESGERGAPVTGRREHWEGRSPNWEAVLFEHVEKGYSEMPAKGGDAGLSRYDIDAAAEYMLGRSFPELSHD